MDFIKQKWLYTHKSLKFVCAFTWMCTECWGKKITYQFWSWKGGMKWEEKSSNTEQSRKKRQHLSSSLICLSLCLPSPCFFSVYFPLCAYFLVYLACFVHLLSLPIFPFLFSFLNSVSYLFLHYGFQRFPLRLWFSCSLGPDIVPWLRRVCVLMPAGWETEILED